MAQTAPALFHYEGALKKTDGTSEIVQSTIAAESESHAERLLEAMDLELWRLERESDVQRWLRSIPWPGMVVRLFGGVFPWMRAKVQSIDLHLFFRNLASFSRTQKTMDAVDRMSRTADSATLRSTAKALASHMQSMKLSKAVELYPDIFDPAVGRMIAGGEESDLAMVFDRIADWYKEQHESSLDLRALLVNPLSMAIGGYMLGLGLRFGYVPTLTQLYDTYMNGALPWFTRPTIAALNVLTDYKHLEVIGLVALVAFVVVRTVIMRQAWGRMGWEWLTMNLGGPLGKLYRAEVTEQVAWGMSLAHGSKRTWDVAFQTAAEQSRSILARIALQKMHFEYTEGGKSWVECFRDDTVLHPLLRNYLEGAEGSAKPEDMCAAAASTLSTNVAAFRRTVKEFLPQALSAAVMAPIAWMIFSLLAPMFLLVPHMLQQLWTHASNTPMVGH